MRNTGPLPVEKILEVSRFVRARFSKLPFADREDIEQGAALAAVKTARRYRLRPNVNPFNILATAAFREVALEVARAGHQFSFSERARKEKKVVYPERVRIDGKNEPVGGAVPDARIVSDETTREVQSLRVQLRRRIEDAIERLRVPQRGGRTRAATAVERSAASMLVGLDDEGADRREVVWRTGMTNPAVAKVVASLRAELRGDPEACRLRGVISRSA